VLSIPLAYWLANSKSKLKPFIEAIIALPLVLPPTVIGFYLLIAFNPNGGIGSFFNNYLGLHLIFSFTGLVIGSVIYSFPFMVQPLQVGFSNLPKGMVENAIILGKSKFQILTKVVIPNIKQAVITAIVLTFAHTVGEFGVVLMIGGNIPKSTKVVSIAIYEQVESLNYTGAHIYSALLIGCSFLVLLFIYFFKNKPLTWLK
jgi:molybdate transport system permease protein